MKNIQKLLAWITSGVLAIISIVFISLYVVENQQNADYKDIIAKNLGQIEEKDGQLTRDIKIKVDALDNTQDTEMMYKDVLVFKENNELRTLQDLLETKTEDFKLGPQTTYGKMVEEINGKSEWIKAVWAEGSWWKISSLDYVAKYPDKQGKGPQAKENGDLNVGIQGAYLTDDFTFTFTQVKA